jgi:tRNA-2-methylthio-N6-dimethylallyladenosine synthase
MVATRKRYYVVSTTLGCATNLLENAAWREYLAGQGYEPAPDPAAADLIVINTCAYSREVEDASTRMIAEYQARFGAQKQIRVAGCYPGINPDRLKSVFPGERIEPPRRAVDFFSQYHRFDPQDFGRLTFKHHAVRFLRGWYFGLERLLGRRFQPLHHVLETVMVNERFHLLTVSRGCLGTCTFCAIRNAKGRVESRPLADIVREFEAGLARGVRDFWLLGDDLGCWGRDAGTSFAALLAALRAHEAPFRLVINYLDPTFLLRDAPALAEHFADPRVISVNIPIQSGSPRLLRRMGRSPAIDRVIAWVRAAKRANPALVVKTNVMVGFPGETWRDLVRSWRAVFDFDAAVALAFSPRPNTPAAAFPGQHGERARHLRLELTNAVILARHLQVLALSLLRPPA